MTDISNHKSTKSKQIFLKKQKSNIKLDLKPTQFLVVGFLLVIVIGTSLLTLPFASKPDANGVYHSVGVIDALFTATSAVCVTGLVVVTTVQQWTLFGQVVIMILIQVGGLGFMTLATTLFILIGKKISLKERLLIQEALNQNTISGMVRLVRYIFLGTLIIEGLGAIILTLSFAKDYSLPKAIYLGIFHSISAFCNAGFDVIGDSSLTPYAHNWSVNLVVMGLIIIGGVGYTVWIDLLKTTKTAIEKKLSIKGIFRRLTLHTKIVLVMTAGLLISGTIIFFLLEMGNPETIGGFTLGDKLLASMFHSVSPRTAGFNTIPLDKMGDGTVFIMIVLMFIGGSPAGTAGGIKTVTMGIIVFFLISVVSSKEETEVFNRRIPDDLVKRSLAIMMISLTIVITVTIILSITESFDFISVLFETVSAFATVGLTLGITSKLTIVGKLIICITMFIGRLGPMTFAVALATNAKKNKTSIHLPEERIMVG